MAAAPISNRPLHKENIPGKIIIYRRFLKKILRKCKITKGRLDMYQVYLRRINSFIQLSVIYVSAASTFIQALTSKSYDVVFESSTDNLLDNSTDTTTTSNIIDQNTLSQLVPIITLSTTTYASVIIAGARHMKIEEREGNK